MKIEITELWRDWEETGSGLVRFDVTNKAGETKEFAEWIYFDEDDEDEWEISEDWGDSNILLSELDEIVKHLENDLEDWELEEFGCHNPQILESFWKLLKEEIEEYLK